MREEALPQLGGDRTAAELAEIFRTTPDRAPALVRAALGKAAASAGVAATQARLVLAMDQMEELFTAETEQPSREELVRLLAALAGSGIVWVIGDDPRGFLSPLWRDSRLFGVEGWTG